MAEGTPIEQIDRALAALEMYSEHWVLENMGDHVAEPLELMMYKDRNGRSIWLEQIQIRSQLLLARAIERQNELNQPLGKIEIQYGEQGARRIFERALEQAGEHETVRGLVETFREKYGKDLTVEFIEWLKPRLGKSVDDVQA